MTHSTYYTQHTTHTTQHILHGTQSTAHGSTNRPRAPPARPLQAVLWCLTSAHWPGPSRLSLGLSESGTESGRRMASGRSPVTPGRPPSPQEPRLLSRSWVIRGPHDPPLWLNLAHRAGLGPAPSRPLWESPTWTAARAAGRPFKRPHRQAALRAGLRWTDAQEPSGRPRGAGRTVWVPGPGQPQPQGGAVGERGRAPPRPGSGHGSWEAPGSAGTERSHRGLTGVTEPPGGTPGACPARECAVPPDLCPGHRTGGPGSSARPGGHTRREPFSASSSRLLWVVRGLAGTSPSPAKGGGRGPVRAPAGDRPLRSERTRVSAAQPDPTLAPKEPECSGMRRNAPECTAPRWTGLCPRRLLRLARRPCHTICPLLAGARQPARPQLWTRRAGAGFADGSGRPARGRPLRTSLSASPAAKWSPGQVGGLPARQLFDGTTGEQREPGKAARPALPRGRPSGAVPRAGGQEDSQAAGGWGRGVPVLGETSRPLASERTQGSACGREGYPEPVQTGRLP